MRQTMKRIILLITLAISLAAVAEPVREDAAKYRQSIMKALSGHNGAISMMVRGKAGDPDNLGNHVQALVNLKGEIESLFEQSSDLDDDRALSAIWENPAAFADAIENFEVAVEALSEVADGGEIQAIDAAHRQMAKACKGCHEDFRLKKED